MNTLKKTFAAVGTTLMAAFVWVDTASAQISTGLSGSLGTLSQVGSTSGLGTGNSANLPTLIGGIINAVLGLLGIIFVILVIYAGFLFMFAQGDSSKTQKATNIIITAIIGLVITVAAYAISSFVINALVSAAA